MLYTVHYARVAQPIARRPSERIAFEASVLSLIVVVIVVHETEPTSTIAICQNYF